MGGLTEFGLRTKRPAGITKKKENLANRVSLAKISQIGTVVPRYLLNFGALKGNVLCPNCLGYKCFRYILKFWEREFF